MSAPVLASIANSFAIQGEIQQICPLGKGQINDTYLVKTSQMAYVLQAINPQVFPQPALVMRNMRLVLNHLAWVAPEETRLRLLPQRDSSVASDCHEAVGCLWRMTNYLEGVHSFDRVETAEIAHQAARGYGRFFRQLYDLPIDQLAVTLPGFHNVKQRFKQLEQAVQNDPKQRLASVQAEVAAFRKWAAVVDNIYELSLTLPIRLTHNDTKISNVLLRSDDYEPVAVIDLDTVMPGSVLFDVGDMIRTFVSPADEEEADLNRVYVRTDVLQALLAGYRAEAADYLTEAENQQLVEGGKMLLFTQFVRFLTDYLNGDIYYQKIHYPTQNLVRARNQLHLFLDLIAR